MACETAGGTGVGPAVMRYCLMKGFGVTGRGGRGPGRKRRLAADDRAEALYGGAHAAPAALVLLALLVELALQVVAELLEVEARGDERDEDDERRHARDHADAAEPQGGRDLALAGGDLPPLGHALRLAAEHQRRDGAGQRDEEQRPERDEQEREPGDAEPQRPRRGRVARPGRLLAGERRPPRR